MKRKTINALPFPFSVCIATGIITSKIPSTINTGRIYRMMLDEFRSLDASLKRK